MITALSKALNCSLYSQISKMKTRLGFIDVVELFHLFIVCIFLHFCFIINARFIMQIYN